MSLSSHSSPEILTPDSCSIDPHYAHDRSQLQSQPRSQPHYSVSNSSFLPNSNSAETASLDSPCGPRSSIDWSSFDEQKRRNEEGWRKRRLIKAQKALSQSAEVTNSLQSQMNHLRMDETQRESHVDAMSSGQSPLRDADSLYNIRPSGSVVQSSPDNMKARTTQATANCQNPPSIQLPPSYTLDPAYRAASTVINPILEYHASYSGRDFEIEVYDDDDAPLRQLMAQAEQAQKAEQKQVLSVEVGMTSAPRQDPEFQLEDQASRQNVAITPSSHDKKRQRAIVFLESMFIDFMTQIKTSVEELNAREVDAPERGRSKRGKRKIEDEESSQEGTSQASRRDQEQVVGVEMRLKNRQNGGEHIVSFPDDPLRCSREPVLHKIAQQLRVAGLLYEAVLTRCVTTLRDIYYKDVQLFKKQEIVDKLVDRLVTTAGLKRQDFMVCATSKGLIASASLKVYLKSGDQLCLSATTASLIPPIERIDKVESTVPIEWVLIVEKDAVFQVLLSLNLLAQADLGPGVLITGKGYPDLATIQLCHLIHQTFPAAKFHALVDADPHGIHIMQVYAHGSAATRHSVDHAGLALGDRLNWMGVKASQWTQLGVKYDDLLPLTAQDHSKAMSMLRNPALSPACRRELQQMLHLQRKAEIQIVDDLSAYVVCGIVSGT